MGFKKAVVNFFLKGIFNIFCKVDIGEYIETLKKNKPSILMFNHINFVETVVLITHAYPVKVTGLAKAETWKNPLFSFLFTTYEAVPIDRRGAFSDSFKKVRETIEDKGFYVCVAPEGHRSKTGVLQKGKAGIIQLAIDTGLSILPVGNHGGQCVWENIRRLKRTTIYIKSGRPFRIKIGDRPGREEREEILSEVMGQLAGLLPQEMRGIYSNQAEKECKHLEFME